MPEQINHNEQVEAQKTGPQSAEDLDTQVKKQEVKAGADDFERGLEENEQPKTKAEIEFAKVTLEEFAKLLERRAGNPEGKMGEEFAKHDLENAKQIREEFIPRAESGDFVLEPWSGEKGEYGHGNVGIVFGDIQPAVFGNAPNNNWDKEFKQNVLQRLPNNEYIKKLNLLEKAQ